MQGLFLLSIKVLQCLLALLIGLFPTRHLFANGKKGQLDDAGRRILLKQGRRHDGFTGNNTTLDTSPVNARRKYLFLSLKANNVHDLFHLGAVCRKFFKVVFFELHHGREVFGVAGIVTYMGLPDYDGVVVSHGDSEICVGLDQVRRVDESIYVGSFIVYVGIVEGRRRCQHLLVPNERERGEQGSLSLSSS